jgi:hypothetical protein
MLITSSKMLTPLTPDEQMKVPRKACCFDLDQYPALKGERADVLD